MPGVTEDLGEVVAALAAFRSGEGASGGGGKGNAGVDVIGELRAPLAGFVVGIFAAERRRSVILSL